MLINGGSFSSTGILSSYLEYTKRAIFIGEEAAGNKTVISGSPTDFVLPFTKLTFEVSASRYTIRNDKNTGHGVIPAFYKIPVIDDVITGDDVVKDVAMSLISKNKK